MSNYSSFQGRVYLGKRDVSGNPYELRTPGNVASLVLSLSTDVLEHYESTTGQRALDHRMVRQKNATLSLTVEEFTKENLALALYGNYVVGAGGTVTEEEFCDAIIVGDRFPLAHPKVSSLVVKDSASPQATLVLGTDYTVDTDFGAVVPLREGTFVEPLVAAYTYGVVTDVGIFTQPFPERFLRFEGINTAASGNKVLVELYRTVFNPLKELSFISNEYNKFELDGALLADSTKPYDATLGQFGRIVQL